MKTPVNLTVGGRFRMLLAYDGTNFTGWAKQPGLRTVQGELLKEMQVIFGKSKDDFGMRVAGRTDAGVHADAQVIHVDFTDAQIKRVGRSTDVAGRLTALLPDDIHIYTFERAPEGFDARFSATGRRYIYRIADGASFKSPKLGRYALYFTRVLDVEKMNDAAQALLGLNDFGAFCKQRDGATTIRDLKKIKVSRVGGAKGIIEIELVADAFCHNMCRSIVGALIKVGDGKFVKGKLTQLLKAAKREHGYKTVEPHGLTLMEIFYPANSKLASQAILAKDTRSLDDN